MKIVFINIEAGTGCMIHTEYEYSLTLLYVYKDVQIFVRIFIV